MESKSKYEGTSTIVEFPIGVVLELIDNLPFRFGAKHTVTYSANSSSVDTTSWTPTVTNTVYANGSSTSSVMGYANNTSEYSYSSYTITHATTYYYGASWWPLPYLQVDFTGCAWTGCLRGAERAVEPQDRSAGAQQSRRGKYFGSGRQCFSFNFIPYGAFHQHKSLF